MSYHKYHPRRKYIQARRKKKMVLAGGAFLSFAVIASVFIITARGEHGGSGSGGPNAPQAVIATKLSESEEMLAPSSANITVEGVDISGLSRSEAEKKLAEAFPWKLQLEFEGEKLPVENQLEPEMKRILDQVYSQNHMESSEYSFNEEALRQGAEAAASGFAAQLNRSPIDSQVVSFDRDTGIYEYSKEKNGLQLDEEKLAEAILAAIESREFSKVIAPSVAELPPARTQAQAKEQYQVIGSFTTKTTNNKNRNQNISLAVDAIDGRVLQPGEEFSFNMATGNRTKEKGYQPAGAYKNGLLIEEPGGGVCQVSTTLYHAIIKSGFKTTERNSHSFAPSYVEPGQDAMVSFDGYAGPDLKFVNTSKASVVLRAAFLNNQLKLSVVGLPVLEDGVQVSIRSEKVGETAPPAPAVEENPSLPFGEQREVESAKAGSTWKSYRVLTKDGKVIQETPLHNSNYRPKAAIIQQNTTVPGQPVLPDGLSETLADGSAVPPDGGQLGGGIDAAPENPDGQSGGAAAPPDAAAGDLSGRPGNGTPQPGIEASQPGPGTPLSGPGAGQQ